MSDLVKRLDDDWCGAISTARRYVDQVSDAMGGKINKSMHEMPAKHGDLWAHALAAEDGALDRIAELERELAETTTEIPQLIRNAIRAERTARLTAEADCAALVEALEPFASFGQWLFARPISDDEPVLNVAGINGMKGKLTRGQFKAAHSALASHGTRGKALLAVVEAAKKVDWQASADARAALSKALAALDAREAKVDPREPDYSRSGIFVDHNCWKCESGKRPCVNGEPRQCEYPHARND